jgi:hypothetical protein
MNAGGAPKPLKDAKRVFFRLGTCSRTLCFLLDREFGHMREDEEHALDPLAGGILRRGHQCGMLWGASLAVGAEALRRCGDPGRAVGMTIRATRHVLESFVDRTNSPDCLEITGCDWRKPFSVFKHMFSGKFYACFRLAEQWAPEAIRAAREGLALSLDGLPAQPLSCASEVAKKMGASGEEMVMVAGFAGGIGLSGRGCGALGAAVWMKTLDRVRKKKYKSLFSDPLTEETIRKFLDATGNTMECEKITGRRFQGVGEHTEFVKGGGCADLIERLARS